MSSPFAGVWELYGRENVEVLAQSLALPNQFCQALKSVRIREEIHVTGDSVHVIVLVPAYVIPAHAKELNFTFGVEHEHSLPFGKSGKGLVKKESDTKWHGTFAHPEGQAHITRELRNGEMWVHIESCSGVKTIRKFERVCDGGKTGCPNQSPFQGTWRLYGSDNFDKFMEAIGVPAHWRCIFANLTVNETIHVNGDDVHVKIHLPEVAVPAHTHEYSGKFGEPHEISLPFGHHATATPRKQSETKWEATLTCPTKLGEALLTREIVGNDMWTTIEAHGKRAVHKFQRV